LNNVLFITPYFRPAQLGGGGQISIENLVDLLRNDYNVTIICYNHDFGCKRRISELFFIKENKLCIYLFSFKDFYKIYKEIKLTKFKVVYFNSFFSPICLLFHFIYFFDNKIISPKGEFYNAALRKKVIIKKGILLFFRFFKQKSTFHSTSIHEVDSIKKYFPLSKILIARDIPALLNQKVQRNNKIYISKNTPFKIIYSSRIEPKKNLSFLPRLLIQVDGPIQFDIYGDISDLNYFEQVLVDLKGLPTNIIWKYCGRLNFNDAKVVFSNYDLFIFPTLGENYGYVIYESLQCGCPILLSKNTTPWDDLEAAGVGYNIKLNDIKVWVDKIRYFKDMSHTNRKNISNNCLQYIQKKYDINNIINENKQIFKLY
jgi:glycosyltransferase involved in cell wall biosynthesis